MRDFSQLILEKKSEIVECWIDAVKQDQHISSDDILSSPDLRDHIPLVIEALATVLSPASENDVITLVEASLQHGMLRAEQSFDAQEIAREYRLLRRVIFSVLEPEILQSTTLEVFRAFRMIDALIDEAIAQCFKSYVDARFRELQQVHSQLTLNNQELNRLINASQENLSYLAHEFKTPLNSIIGYSELLLRQRPQTEKQNSSPNLQNIGRVLRNGRQLLRLVNDVLDFSRYEAGRMQLHPVTTDVRSIIYSVVEMMEPLAAIEGLEITVECSHAPDQVLSDPLRLQQVLTNLLSNAVRYTKVGSIHVNCQVDSDQRWSIAITDTGVGISPEDQVRIFDPYFQGDTDGAAKPANSTGLGLAIVSRLVTLLQGKIELMSQVDIGSTFTVNLPIEIKTAETVTCLEAQ